MRLTGAPGWITMAVTLVLARPVAASQPLDGLLACRRITDTTARLACFDRESAMVAAHVAVRAGSVPPTAAEPAGPSPPAAAATAGSSSLPSAAVPARGGERAAAPETPAAGQPAARDSTLDPRQTFGLGSGQILAREEAARRAPRPLDHIEAHIVGMAGMGDGREIFTLDNHQVWAEIEPAGDLYAKPGEAVEISRGWLGSYSLSLKSRRNAKVTRLQ